MKIRMMAAILFGTVMMFGAEGSAMKAGKLELGSAGPLAFAPHGVLLIGDTAKAQVAAVETGDGAVNKAPKPFELKAVNEKIAAMLGTTPDQILIQDVAVNPLSKNVYLSVSRGRGPDAAAVILRTDASGKLSELNLSNVKHAVVALPNAPAADAKDRRGQSLRVESITDLGYVNGRVVVAGLSNEEFASTLRAIPYPFQGADKGAGIEIFHGAHGRFETNAPVRTFVSYEVEKKPHLLAAYTCTPLVKIPVSELTPGNKVKGTTIAELGNRNRPLDMIVYNKGGQDYILMANSSRGVMKLPTAKLEQYPGITAQTEKQGVPYETIADLKGVQQLDKYDDANAVLLSDASGTLDLRTITLP
jgi:hypothetical protein